MNTKKISIISVFIALSVVGSFIVVPSMAGTVAFDSMPAFVCAVVINPIVGGLVGFLAHILSSSIKGLPLGIFSHLIVGIMMFISVYVFGWIYLKGQKIVAIIVGTILNGPISLLPFLVMLGKGFFMLMVLPLSITAFANIVLASLVAIKLKGIINYE